jgi:hypothetical protein
MLYIGVDPGRSGAVALVGPCWRAEACRLSRPLREVYLWLTAAIAGQECLAVLEHVHSFPGQGVASTFAFGASYGACQMLLAACVGEWTEVAPQRWQKAMECRTKGQKRVSTKACRDMFPHLKIHAWNADAFLLALYLQKITETEE